MKSRSFCIGTIAASLILSLSVYGQNANNPIEDALLRWYPAGPTLVPMHGTCVSPQGLAFDGAHMWVACSGSSEIDEYNTSDGSFVQSVTGLQSSPSFLLYDGANIWATNPTAGTITAVQSSTGSVLGTPVNVGTNPAGMAFDGQYIWVTNQGSNSITQVKAATRVVVKTINVNRMTTYDCVGPTSIAYDPFPADGSQPTSIWVVCGSTPEQVMELTASGGFVAATAPSAIGGTPGCNNVAFDGRYIWLPTSSGPGSSNFTDVFEIDTTNIMSVTKVVLPQQGSEPVAVAYDGMYIWVANASGSSPTVTKILPSTGAMQSFFPNGGSGYFVAFDGGNIWVSTPNQNGQGGYTVSKM